MKKIILICGVSGSGKTWVCKQLTKKFEYVPHDEHIRDLVDFLISKPYEGKPFIAECPFAERKIRDELMQIGFEVIPFFVIESPEKTNERFFLREGRQLNKSAMTRLLSIKDRAKAWKAFHGTSEEVLKALQNL